MSGEHSAILDYENEVDLELKRKIKMFLYHGDADPLIEAGSAEKSYQEFTDHELNFTF